MGSGLKKSAVACGGFSLFELILVLFITVMFSGIALASSNLANRHKLNLAANLICSDIRRIQQQNLDNNGTYAVLFDCYNDVYYLKKCEIGAVCKKVVLPAGIDLTATNFDFDNNPGNGYDNELRFNSKGEPFRKNGILCGGHLGLKNKNGKYLYVIVASVTGQVRIGTAPP
ncbi:MAG: hypothetical protein XD78_1707 [Desulfotomaculum sp. 46_296]|nr:MAG: hypothetical protein XD78_1707 [Desulfotomaculum sp. 46_296]KUK84623.1 MAG: hypothetical protein XE00_0632 [Desulfofundulus kuznetsovii]HAU32690.1 hypothetical protein [Desulfotomaculum sp.]